MTQGGLQEDGDLRLRQLTLHLSHSEWQSDDNNVCSGSGGSLNTGKGTFPPLQHKPRVSLLNFIALQNWQVIDMSPRIHDASDL
ncbi:hypothetical protein TNCV_4249051 [Trichonephila clavipes]|nr:hypothetical protein TNCV_4249051 [Trichonephila clavipes]